MMRLWRLLTSPRTCAWLGLFFCLSAAAGSVALERFPDLFADMDALAFATWFARKGLRRPGATLWLYGLLAATGLLAVSAACCTAERLARIFRGEVPARRILPQLMHVAFLGVVLAHLVSALCADRVSGVMVLQGGVAPVRGTGWALRLDRLDAVPGDWPPRDVSASITVFRDRTPVAGGSVRANAPLFHGGYGIYLKRFGLTARGDAYAVFDANRDPGAPAILVAALLFTAANLLHILFPGRVDA